MENRIHQGRRVTDAATLNVVEMVLGEINQELVGLINRHGAKAVGVSGQDGRFIHARKLLATPDEAGTAAPDLGFVEVTAVGVRGDQSVEHGTRLERLTDALVRACKLVEDGVRGGRVGLLLEQTLVGCYGLAGRRHGRRRLGAILRAHGLRLGETQVAEAS